MATEKFYNKIATHIENQGYSAILDLVKMIDDEQLEEEFAHLDEEETLFDEYEDDY